jgi:LysM repeat protein
MAAMAKRLIAMMSVLFLFFLSFTSMSAAANGDVPLNVDLKQKIATDLLPYHEYNRAVVQKQSIYIPERQGNKITAVNALDGKVKWEYATNGNTAYYSFAGAGDVLFFQANGTLTALKDNGSGAVVLWTKPYHASNFTIDGGNLYLFKGNSVAALDLQTGTEKWSYALPAREKQHSNIAFGNGKLYFVTDNQIDMERKMYAMNAATAQVLWTTNSIDYYATKLAFADNKLYVKSYKEMNAFDANNGLFLWKFLVQENFDFEMNASTIFTKTSNGTLSAYDRNTRALRWTYKLGSSSRGPLMVTSSHVLANGDSSIKWLDIQSGQLARNLTAPGTNIQPYAAAEGALVAIDSSYNLYYYASANDTVKPVLTLDSVPARFSPIEVGTGRIFFHLSEDAYVKMLVKNSQGQVVRTIDYGLLNASWNEKYYDGKDDSGKTLTYGEHYTLAFELKDLSGNEAVSENLAKKMHIADIRGTTVEQTIARKGPALSNDVLVSVPSGTQLTILEETADWYKVNFYVDSRGYEGFVLKNAVATRSNPDPKANSGSQLVYSVVSGDTLWKISQKFGVSIQAIADANKMDPAAPLMVGQKLIIPGAAAQPTPAPEPTPAPQPSPVVHSVVSGDTLWKISQKYSVSIQSIADANKMDPAAPLMVGQKLTIPGTAQPAPTPAPEPAPAPTMTHSVQSGDTLWKIAQRYGVTIQAIADANKIDPAVPLMIGQKLIIPGPAPAPVPTPTVTHTVQSGDTLWKIAQQYGVTIQAIADENKLDPAQHLYVGQKLVIPAT